MTPRDLLRIEHTSVQTRLRRFRVGLLVSFDAFMILLAYVVVALLRYDVASDVPWLGVTLMATVTVAVHMALSLSFKTYRGRTLVASSEETLRLGFIAVAGAAAAQMLNLIGSVQMGARSLPVAAAGLSVGGMVVGRALWRRYSRIRRHEITDATRYAVIVGAGEAGQQLAASMRRSRTSTFVPVAFVDDDRWKRHLQVEGVAVMGTVDDLESVLHRTGADLVVVAIPSASSQMLKEVADRAGALGVDVKVLPPVTDLFGGRVSIRDVRDINVSDLLGRSAIETDIESVAGFLKGKRVLVTGAGGSIGSELCRQIAKWSPGELMMLDRDESGLHGVQLSITGQALLDSDDVILADIRDVDALESIFAARRPEVVFHAAALKHLPMLEQYPAEAVKTNVVGTANVLAVSERHGVERFVNISTDKAANPTSVLGFSKRVAERLTAEAATRSNGIYMSVRFGNVLGSRGSVLTTFAAQIAAGGPVTVTHPDVTRYFMTVAEAVQLVLQAGAIGKEGEVLILDMGQPVRIDDVAKYLIQQSGERIDIVYTGLREGEKMDEILLAENESDARPVHQLISHVRVSPLDAALVNQALVLSTDSVTAQLHDWCAQPDVRAICPATTERASVEH